MQKKAERATVHHYTSRATLAALGIKLRSIKLLAPVEQTVLIPQKTIRHKPLDKLMDAFIALLAGAHGLVEVNTRVRSDVALQRAFGRECCADQSLVQTTLNACTAETVRQMEQAVATIFRARGRAFRHHYEEELQLIDVDMTGLPCGKKAEGSKKGYFSSAGIRYGRQMGRVVATLYEEIVTDQLYPGNVQLNRALRPLVMAAEEVLGLDYAKRQRTILRIDAGGGSLDDVNWCLDRGYHLHCKDLSGQRAEAWAATVKQWYVDPKKPERQVGWAVPAETPDYVRPVRRLVIRWQDRRGRTSYAMLISTLSAGDVIRLLGQPVSTVNDSRLVALAYASLGVPGIWRIPVGGGEETPVLDLDKAGYWRYWAVVSEGIYYATAEEPPARPLIKFFSFANRQSTEIATPEKAPDRSYPGLSVSADGRRILYAQMDQSGSDIMLMEDFH